MSDFSKTSASTSTSTPVSTPAVSSNAENTINGFRLPDVSTLLQAVKLAAVEDRPIMMDYWVTSIEKKTIIGVRENKEKLLVKSQDEYTSPIGSIYKVGNEYIILTENSIYIVDAGVQVRRIDSQV
jgi:hypothetical protein